MSAKKKRRHCPALGADIPSSRCGSERNSRIQCPPNCEFNPLGPDAYETMLDIEEQLTFVSMKRLIQEDIDDDPHFWNAYQNDSLPFHHLHATIVRKLFLDRDENNRTFVDRWKDDGFQGIKNDAITILDFKRRVKVGLLEVQFLPRPGWVRVVDLLRPESGAFDLRDNTVYEQAVRFQTLLCWYYDLPHYRRVCGNGTLFPDYDLMEPLDALKTIARHLDGPDQLPALSDWLIDHFEILVDSMTEIAKARHHQMLTHLDASFGKAIYEITRPWDECRERLDKHPEVEITDLTEEEIAEGFSEARVWLSSSSPMAQTGLPGQPILGRVLLGQHNCRVEAMGLKRFREIRQAFEEQLGDSVRFTAERVDDLGKQIADTSDYDASLVPPELINQSSTLDLQNLVAPASSAHDDEARITARAHSASLRQLIDQPIPALNDKSPRQAADDPALRQRLIRWVKNAVADTDKHNLHSGADEDANWLIRELGLSEIDFPPPPPRTPRQQPDWAEEDDDLNEFNEPYDPEWDLPAHSIPAPPLPSPISINEAFERMSRAGDVLAPPFNPFEELDRQRSRVINLVCEAATDLIPDHDFDRSMPFLLRTWFALVPPGYLAPELELPSDVIRSRILEYASRYTNPAPLDIKERIRSIIHAHSQPEFILVLVTSFLHIHEQLSPEMAVSVNSRPLVLGMLTALVELVDQQLSQ